jgi:F-type H+-transporting ATPase subunit beta
MVSLADALDGCERILRDEFKDYPESALYMIGAISEAKGKAKPAAPAKPDTKPEAKNETKSAAEKSSENPTLVSPLKPDAKPQPKVEHAAHAP